VKPDGNLILVGMMGAGKTTVGRLLAKRLKRTFYDSDEEIERRCGVRIPVIFDIEGEAGFRARETQVLAELCALERAVIATGGGAVVYLHARPSQLWQRVRHDRNRPLLATPDPEKTLEGLYTLRDPLYREVADLVLDTGRQSAGALAKEILVGLEVPCSLSA